MLPLELPFTLMVPANLLPSGDIDRVKSHLEKYYKKMGEDAPWDRD